MTPRVGRALALAAVLLLPVLAAAGLPAVAVPAPADPAAPATAAPAATATGTAVDVQVTGMTPQVLSPGQDLTVALRVRNTGATTLTTPRVAVSLDRGGFISRSSLDRWRDADPDARVGSVIGVADLPGPLAPGQTATVDVVVPAGDVGLPRRATAWGARGLAVWLVDRSDDARPRLGVTRTFLLWFPPQEVSATRVSVLAPVVGPAVDPFSDPAASLDRVLGGRRATDLLAATTDPAVTWVLDPELLREAAAGGTPAREWRAEVLAGLTDREVQLLPAFDPDVAALAHSGHDDLLTAAIRRATTAARDAGLPDAAQVSLLWPADPRPDLATAALAGRAGLALVVGPGELLPPSVLTYTPTGRTTVQVQGAEVPVLVPDERLSTALVTGAVESLPDPPVGESGTADGGDGVDRGDAPPAEPVTPPRRSVTPAEAAQDLLAELAVITRERPSDARHLLLTVPRDWHPDVDVARAQLDALGAAPWVRTQPVSALLGAADPGIDRGTLPEREVREAEERGPEIAAVRTAVDRRAGLAGMVAEPETLLGDVEREVLAPVSVAWREDPAGRSAIVDASRAATAVLADAVTVEPPSDVVNLISTSGDLSVQVRNALPEPVDVTVGLRPTDLRLRVDEPVPVTIPGESDMLVRVPVHAVQSADLQVTVEVRTPDGTLVDDDTTFPMRVRAEWEGIGTAILGTLLAIGLVVGLVRTIRRGRTARRAAPAPEAGPDTLSPEEAGSTASPEPQEAADGGR